VTVPGTNWVLQERLGKEKPDKDGRRAYGGAFGEVWKARNSSDRSLQVFKFCFKRDRVPALKREARLLKQLRKYRHPNLVEVYDVTEGDRPPYYLEMEYVEGPSLEEWLSGGPPLKERLEAIAQVADALDTVHAAGIYHRDIKPSNILLTHRQDGRLQAKLTDFGLGAAEDQQLLRSIYASRPEGVAGTWDYIAPELRTGEKASPQTDLYSLGVTLLQVATGNLHQTLGDWEDHVESEVLREDVRRCVATDPAQRWKSAGELATALRSHEERLERLRLEREEDARRLRARRLRRMAAAAVVVGVAAVAGAVIYVVSIQREQARTIAEKYRADQQRDLADQQRDVAEEQRHVAQQEAEKARAATEFLQDMLASVDPKSAQGREVSVRMALDEAAKKVGEKFRDQPLVEASVRTTIGMTYEALGLYDAAEPHLAQALEIRRRILGQAQPDTLSSMHHLACLLSFQGKLPEAEKLNRETLAARQTVLGKDHTETLDSMNNLACVLGSQGKYAEAEPLHRQTVAARRQALGKDHPDTLLSVHNLACLLHNQGQYAEAEQLHRQTLEARQRVLGVSHPDTLLSMYDLACALSKQKKHAEAEGLYRQALAAMKRVLGRDHPTTLVSMDSLADCLEAQGNLKEADQLRDERSKIQPPPGKLPGPDHNPLYGPVRSQVPDVSWPRIPDF
jgi:non-specific serine/threonine protein kinase/serine/threonine-protein kinase